MKLLAVSIVSKSTPLAHAGNRASETQLGTSKSLGEIYRLCATIPVVVLLDSY